MYSVLKFLQILRPLVKVIIELRGSVVIVIKTCIDYIKLLIRNKIFDSRIEKQLLYQGKKNRLIYFIYYDIKSLHL